MIVAVYVTPLPAQAGFVPELMAIDTVGVTAGSTVTLVVDIALVHPATLALTLYVPDAAAVAAAITGFCNAELYEAGPLQEYVAPGIVEAVRLIEVPSHTGLLADAAGAAGTGLTVTVVTAVLLLQPAAVAFTLYVPASAGAAEAITGFCNVEL